jgi:hypothetical protein
MVLNLEILQQFINRNSTNQNDHKIWNQTVGKHITMAKLAKDVGLSKNQYRPYELFWVIENKKEMESNTTLERTCKTINCISHYIAIQHCIDSVFEMDANTYMKSCERFDKHCGSKNSETGCINWNGYVNISGYGEFEFLARKRKAHCVAYMLSNCEDIPKGLFVRHLCPKKNKRCVNPDHLTLGTPQQNSNDEINGQFTLKGENHPNAIISNEVAQIIIDSYDSKKSVQERATEYNVSKDIIISIDAAKTWRSLMTSEQITKRESIERRKQNKGVLPNDIILKIKNSNDTLAKCAKKYNVTICTVHNIRKGNYKSILERDKIGFTKVIERVTKNSTKFQDPLTGIEHIIWKNDKSQDPNAKPYKISYFGIKVPIHRASYMVYRKIKSIEEGKVVRHKCLYKHCISHKCLEIGTVQDNANDRRRDNTTKKGEENNFTKITQQLATQIKQTKGIGTSQQRSKFFDVSIGIISSIDRGNSWKHIEDDKIDQEVIDKLDEYVINQPKTKRIRLN